VIGLTDFRARIRTDWPPERISSALEELASSETTRSHDVRCKNCQQTYSYKLEAYDGRTRLSALQWIGEHAYGRAAQAEPDRTKPIDPGIDPSKLDPDARKALIQTLRARLEAGDSTTQALPDGGSTPHIQGGDRTRADG
jgi:hypothetical protein